jgi:hypothetical protein
MVELYGCGNNNLSVGKSLLKLISLISQICSGYNSTTRLKSKFNFRGWILLRAQLVPPGPVCRG